MDTRTWEIHETGDFRTFCIYTDAVVLSKAQKDQADGESIKSNDDKVFPFHFIRRFTAGRSSPRMHIDYCNSLGRSFFVVVTFKSAGDRDEAFETLCELLSEQYNLESYTPSRWHDFLMPLILPLIILFPAGLLLGLGLVARELETSGDWGRDPDALSAIIHAILKGVCSLVGSRVFFGAAIGVTLLAGLLFLFCVYELLTRPKSLPTHDLPMEQRLRSKNLDYVGSARKPE